MAAVSLTHQTPTARVAWPWLRSRRWDLTFVIGSGLLVALPLLLHGTFGVSAGVINIAVALLVGGPHLFSTYITTLLEPRFWRQHPRYTLGAFLMPPAVISLAILDLTLLLTVFLLWASLHVLQQVAWIADCYRAKAPWPAARWSRGMDYAVLFSSLYPFAMAKLVGGTFVITDRVLPIPEFLRAQWFVDVCWFAFGVSLALWLANTCWELYTNRLNGTKTVLIGATVVVSLLIPTADNLDVAFQAMNAWHSLQYLALLWYVNAIRAARGDVSLEFLRNITGPGLARPYYGALVAATLLAGLIIGLLYAATRLSLEQCYYIVLLSSLLVHYYFDTLLFTRTASLVPAQR